MNRNKNNASLKEELSLYSEDQIPTMEKCGDPKLQRLFELKRILVLTDYPMDFYAVAANPQLYGYNIECEVCLVDFTTDTYEILPWIDIYAGLEENGTESNGDMHNGASLDGKPGSIWKDLELEKYKKSVVKDEHGLKVHFLISNEPYNICIPETSRLYRGTIKQCACLWARKLGYDIPLQNVFFSDHRVSSYKLIMSFCTKLYYECQKFDPEQACQCGLDTSALKPVQPKAPDTFRNEWMQGKITVAPLSEENIKNLTQIAGAETAEAFKKAIENLNVAGKGNQSE